MAQFFPVFGDRQQRRIGILGGSFNPAHDGHVHISREAKKRLSLDQVWWLVSPQNPLKPVKGMAPLAKRLHQAKALTKNDGILVGDLESGLHSTRTANVVTALKKRFPRISFVWLMGADNLEQIPRWWHWTRIFHSVCVAVLDRSPYAYRALSGLAAQRFRASRTKPSRALLTRTAPAWSYLAIRRHAASGTAIREQQTLRQQTETRINAAQETPITTSASIDLEQTVDLIMTSLDDNKAQNIVHFDLAGKTSIADRMIVASGTSTRQVTSLAENLITKLKSVGVMARSEGKKQGDWVLVDAGDVIVHIFRPEVREFYAIERLWQTAVVAKTAKVKPAAKKRSATKPASKKKAAKPSTGAKAKAKRKPAKK